MFHQHEPSTKHLVEKTIKILQISISTKAYCFVGYEMFKVEKFIDLNWERTFCNIDIPVYSWHLRNQSIFYWQVSPIFCKNYSGILSKLFFPTIRVLKLFASVLKRTFFILNILMGGYFLLAGPWRWETCCNIWWSCWMEVHPIL